MRSKVVLAIILVAAGVLAIAMVLKTSPSQPAPPISKPAIVSNAVPVTSKPKPVERPAITAATISTNAETNNVALEHEKYVAKRTAELNELAMQKSPEAHQQILDELRNSDKDIRSAALEAIQQANDRSVIPQMKQIADQTDDATEKQAILDAIDFINLPSLTEYLNQSQKVKNAQTGQ